MLISNIVFIFQNTQINERYRKAAERVSCAFSAQRLKDTAGAMSLLIIFSCESGGVFRRILLCTIWNGVVESCEAVNLPLVHVGLEHLRIQRLKYLEVHR